MVAAVVGAYLAWVAPSGGSVLRASGTAAEVADRIAREVRRRWMVEVELRLVNDPYMIPVRWCPADPDLFASWSAIEQAACSAGWPSPDRSRWSPDPAGLAGGGDVAAVLDRVPTRRLVVLGEPGAGKTVLAVRLVLDILADRVAGGPVPVLLQLSSWDPAREHLRVWLERRLCADHPALRARAAGEAKVTWAWALWEAGLLMLVLDGFDEITKPAQDLKVHPALQSLQYARLRLLQPDKQTPLQLLEPFVHVALREGTVPGLIGGGLGQAASHTAVRRPPIGEPQPLSDLPVAHPRMA
jgi:hypothetical protein